MRTRILFFATILAVSLALGMNVEAQQTPATSSAPSTAKSKPATTTSQTAQKPASKTPAEMTTKQKESYALGMNIARGLQKQSVDVDPASVARGIQDSFGTGKPRLTDEEAAAALAELQADVKQKEEAEAAAQGEKNMKEGAAFLAENKTKDGVVTLPSGLQYKILTPGTGPKPAASDTVVCNYRGTFLDGSEFDSSYKRGQPATFAVDHVIKGWTEALQLMPVGSKWQLWIPSDLAYGPRGAGGVIGPNATLVFEVELISIKGNQGQPGATGDHGP